MHSISIDIHSATFTMAVHNPRGGLCRVVTRNPTIENLIADVSAVPSPKQLVVEECHLSQLVKDTLEVYVDRLVIADPVQNRWIARAEFVDDKSSAIKLGKLLMSGDLKEIYHPDSQGAEVRSLFLHYRDLDGQVTRSKNKLKAAFRQAGKPLTMGWTEILSGRGELLDRLKGHPHLQVRARDWFELFERFGAKKQQTHTKLLKRVRKEPAYALLKGIPGIGPVVASGYIALIVTPHRFSRRNKLWRYCGLANQRQLSDDRVYMNRASRSGNRDMKWLVREQFMGGVLRAKKSNRFKREYERLLAQGLSQREARREVQRGMVSVVRAVWMKGEPYQDKHVSKR